MYLDLIRTKEVRRGRLSTYSYDIASNTYMFRNLVFGWCARAGACVCVCMCVCVCVCVCVRARARARVCSRLVDWVLVETLCIWPFVCSSDLLIYRYSFRLL